MYDMVNGVCQCRWVLYGGWAQVNDWVQQGGSIYILISKVGISTRLDPTLNNCVTYSLLEGFLQLTNTLLS
jgi:hypothetical protein